jgi:hypothetical protein
MSSCRDRNHLSSLLIFKQILYPQHGSVSGTTEILNVIFDPMDVGGIHGWQCYFR